MSVPTATPQGRAERVAAIDKELEQLAGWIEYARLAREGASDLKTRRYWGRKLAAYNVLVADLERERAGLLKSD